MRILHVLPTFNARAGGTVEAARSIAVAQEKMGEEVEAVAIGSASGDCLRGLTGKCHRMSDQIPGYGWNLRILDWLRENGGRFDATIVHGIWQFHSLAVWRALKDFGMPYYLFPHGMLDRWFAEAYPVKHFKKMLYWKLVENRVFQGAREVWFTSEEERDSSRGAFSPYRCKEAVVGLGIFQPELDWNRQTSLFFEQFPECRSRKIILYLGRLHSKKGCDLVVRAYQKLMDRYRDWHLVMAGPEGEPGYRAYLKELAGKNECARITWAGMLEGDLKWGALQAADLFFLPSHQENFGISVAEALACGCPVLISRRVNIWREIEAGGCGWICGDWEEDVFRTLRDWGEQTEKEKGKKQEVSRDVFFRNFEIGKAIQKIKERMDLKT